MLNGLDKKAPSAVFQHKAKWARKGHVEKNKKKKKKQHSNTVDASRCNLSAQFGPRSSQKAKLFGTNDVGGSPTGFVSYFLFFYYFSLPTDSNLYVHLSDFGPRLNRPVNLENRFCWRSFPLKIGCFVIELFSLGWFLVCFIFGRTFYVHVNS